jgi:hypothetical protein
MTVAQLKKILEDVPDDFKVILSIDPEGNSFNELDDYCLAEFVDPYDIWTKEDAIEHEKGMPDEDCIVLWPY